MDMGGVVEFLGEEGPNDVIVTTIRYLKQQISQHGIPEALP